MPRKSKKASPSKKRKLDDVLDTEDAEKESPKSKKMKVDQEISDDTNSDNESGSGSDNEPAERLTGVVTSWCHDKGYGFIKPEDGEENNVFCHINQCEVEEPHQNVKVGSKVEFTLDTEKKKPSASNVTAVGGGPCEGGFQKKGQLTKWEVFIEGEDGEMYFAKKRDVESTSLARAAASQNGIEVQFDTKESHDKDSDKKLAAYIIATGDGDSELEASSDEEEDEDVEPTDGKETGVVISWRHDKGFGFIKSETGDLFVHAKSCDLQENHRNIRVGSKVEFKRESGEKGDSATEVSAIGGGTCRGGLQMKGTITNWMGERGFGFVKGTDGEEYFVGDRDIWLDEEGLYPGVKVQFDIKEKPNGKKQAVYCNGIGGHYSKAMMAGRGKRKQY